VYVGHVGIALAVRGRRDAPPLWLLVAASQGCDWGDALFGLLGLRPPLAYGPHGLLLVGVGVAASALLAIAAARGRSVPAGRWSAWAAVTYASHWVADCVTGRKPTIPGGPTLGLGWYSRPALDFVVEGAVIAIGWTLWKRSLPPARDGARRPLAWALLVVLLMLQAAATVVMSRGGAFV
jgi:hypothetical protein